MRDAAPAAWTGARVRKRLVEAFAALPDIGVHSPRLNTLVAIDDAADAGDLAFIQLTAVFLERDSLDRQMLLAWARARASRSSISGLCRELRWSRSSLYKSRDRACETIAKGIAAHRRH